ncbi:MAG: glycerol-3-phosphate 1-O-acyltransferase PlsY [Dehalococcoidia bacterium]|jgi:glycerol-3-phosphate acyltransferase PlsY|nr:glycerol-3-phosphate 1-O-acyltransferase PlsY [Dehalococcoidia bacterium]
MAWQYVVVAVASYLIGSIPSGWLAGKLMRGIDVRDYGSGATGTTNVLRSLGLWPALLVLVADILKAYVAVLATWYIFEPYEGENTAHNLQAVAGVAAIVGHDWPAYLGFRGGKGVAATYGAFAAMLFFPLSVPGLLAVAVAIVLVFRYMSLMSVITVLMGGAAFLGLALAGIVPYAFTIFGGIASALVLFRHRENIRRLLAGTEPKIGQGGERHLQRPPQRLWPFRRM